MPKVQHGPGLGNATMTVRILGEGVSPGTVDILDLSELLEHYGEAVRIVAAHDDAGTGLKDFVRVCLIGIREGSNELEFSLSRRIRPVVVRIAHAVARREADRLPHRAHEKLHELSNVVERRKWTVVWEANESIGLPRNEISSGEPIPSPKTRKARGTTVLYGRVIRVGGKEPRVRLDIGDENVVYIDVTEEQAKELGHRLYDMVGIEGKVEWNSRNWEVVKFEMTRLTAYEATPPDVAIRQLAEVAGDHWDEVDVVGFVNQFRTRDQQ